MTNVNRVLYISYDGMTDQLGQSQVIPYLKGLASRGYQITIVSFEKKERYQKQGDLIKQILQSSGIEWIPERFHRAPSFLAKAYDQWRMNQVTSNLHKKRKFNLIHARSYMSAEAALRIWKADRVPYLFDMRGFWVDERVDNGQWDLSNPIFKALYKIYKKKEKRYFRNAAHVISLTQKGKEELISSYGVGQDKITVIPCCVDLDLFNYEKIKTGDVERAKAEWKVEPGYKLFCYLGSLGGWYLTEQMLDFFKYLRGSIKAKFLFITHDKPSTILEFAEKKGIASEDILVQPAARSQVPFYLSLSDWGIFFIKDAYSKVASSPTKQGEIMAMGIPVICNDIGDTGKIIEDSGAGFVLREFSPTEYQKALHYIETSEAICKKKIREAAFKFYDLSAGIQKYALVYQEILKQS